MRIRTQFLMTMLLFGVVLMAISASAIITNRLVEKARDQEKIAASVAQGASELSYLANDYVIYRENQQLERWQARFASFSSDVSRLDVTAVEQQALVRNIHANTQRLKDVFDSVVSAVGGTSQQPGGTIDPALLQVSWSRMAVQSQGLSSDALRLSQLSGDRAEQAQSTNSVVVIALIAAFIAYFLVNYLMTQRRALKGLATLQAGTAVIGSGNLDFRIEEKRNDEIGDLSRAFNRMTVSLRDVTASKSDLEKEVEERKRIQRELESVSTERQLALDAARMGWWHYDPVTRISLWDERYKEIFEVTGHEKPNDEILKRLHPEDLPGVWANVEAALDPLNPQPYSAEYRIFLPDGSIRWIEAHGIATFEGTGMDRHATGLVGTVADITERKRFEEELKRVNEELEERVRRRTEEVSSERHRLYSVLETLPAYVVLLDRDYHVPFANRFFRDRFGESHGKRCFEYLFNRHESCENCESYKVMKSNAPHHWEWLGPDGRDYDIYDYPFSDADGSLMILEMGIDITERKRAEAALQELNEKLEQRVSERTAELRESEERFRAIAETSPVQISVSRVSDGTVLFTNEAYNEAFGFTQGELIGRKAPDLYVDPADRETLIKTMGEQGFIKDHEVRVKRADGTPFWLSASVRAISYAGEPAILGASIDITERKKNEAELAHLASFPELNPNPIVEVDTAGNVTYLNTAARTRFPDLPVRGGGHPFLGDWEALVDTLRSATMRSLNRDVKIGDAWYVQTVTYLPSDQKFRIYGRNITERKRVEGSLRETRDYLENLLNYANAPIIVWDPQFRIARFNHAFERLTGRTADEVLGKNLDILFPDDSRDESMGHIRRAVAGERWEVVEIPILHRDGTVRVLLWNSANLYAADEKTVIATIAQGQDITERKRAEEGLKRTNAELEAANKELEAFSYSVSHDLRAPLRSMEGFSSALLEDYAEKLDDQGRQYLKYVQESSDLMARLIDDLLKLSRVTRSDMNYEMVNLSEMARSILAECERSEPDRKAQLSIAPGITAYGDRNLLRLALENLLGNAWKFSGKVAQPRIEMGVKEHSGKRAYFVRDNGVGFDMTYADKLFKPFQRLHKASDFAGTGIGLATVQRIIRRHGGEVWAEGKVGEGATFFFTLG